MGQLLQQRTLLQAWDRVTSRTRLIPAMLWNDFDFYTQQPAQSPPWGQIDMWKYASYSEVSSLIFQSDGIFIATLQTPTCHL
jgi:hypothetical protein